MSKGPKILLLDIETAPVLAYVWGLWDQTVSLNQIKSDWHLLSWAAKWAGDPASKTMYQDQRNADNIEDDTKILKGLWKLLDESDVIVTQNGRSFDEKKINARFIMNGFQPPSSFKHVDTLQIAKKHFGFTSNKLEYMSDKLCTQYKKLKHKKFPGFELWAECLKGNLEAWNEMEKYNRHDVLALEELYNKLSPWGSGVNPNLYTEGTDVICRCGSQDFKKNGYFYSNIGKFQRYKCLKCGAETRDRINLFSKEKRNTLRV